MRSLPSLSEPEGVNKALLRDLERKLKTSDLVEWIEDTADSLAAHGDAGGWIELTPTLIQQAGARSYRYSRESLGTSRLQIDGNGNVIVEHHNFRTPEDRRFWIAHELGHLMWRDFDDPNKPLSPAEKLLGADETIEWLCNRFAAALLLPRRVLSRIVDISARSDSDAIRSFDLSRIPDLAKGLRVPERLFTRRLFHDLYNSPTFIVRIGSGKQDSSNDIGPSVRWEAMPRFKLAKPKRLSGRKIPPEMLPSRNVTHGRLDGRWLNLYRDALSNSRARPLSKVHSTAADAFGKATWIGGGDCLLAIQIAL